MELHWEKISKEDGLAVVAPGIWFEFRDSVYSDNKTFYCNLHMHSHYFNEKKYLCSFISNDKSQHEVNIIACKRYASIIASSYLGQQHPYRDYPKNL